MPPTRDVPPKASPLSAKAKGLAGPSPNNPDTQLKPATSWTTTANRHQQEIVATPARSQACVTFHRHASPQGSPSSYMAPATEEATSCSCTKQRASPTPLHIDAPQVSRETTSIHAQAAVFNEPPSAGCHSSGEPATSMCCQSQPLPKTSRLLLHIYCCS